MKQVLRHLLSDFLSAVLFLTVYSASGDVRIAAGVAVAVGLGRFAWLKLTGRQIEPVQWTSLGLVVILGSATMLTQSPRFMMVKPSIVHFAVGGLMLQRGWMIRYITPIARQNVPEATMVAAGYGWAALLPALPDHRPVFQLYDVGVVRFSRRGRRQVGWGALQYAVFGSIVRRRLAQSPT